MPELGIDSSKLTIEKTKLPKSSLPTKGLVYRQNFTDHMLIIEWEEGYGWKNPEIKPYSNISLDPSCCALQYSFELFEGMKAYKDSNDSIRLFRPELNMKRMNESAARICLPNFDGNELIKLIIKLVKLEKDFIPKDFGYSLYLRPTMIGTSGGLGPKPPKSAMIYVICSPSSPYYGLKIKPVKLEAIDYASRAWPGGSGNSKLGGNYSPCVLYQRESAKRGFEQILWLNGEDNHISEVGSMNFFIAFKDNKSGKCELVTAGLDGTILDGVIRRSILELTKEKLDKEKWDIVERVCTIQEIIERSEKQEVLEAFGCGTSAIVTPVEGIEYHGKYIIIPTDLNNECGPLTRNITKWITDIQYGNVESNWSVVV